MAEFEDRKQSSQSNQQARHDAAPVRRHIALVAPAPAPLAPAATPLQRLAFTQVNRSHQRSAVSSVLTASATLQRLAAEVVPERLGLQRQIDHLRAGLPAGAEQAAQQRQAERARPPTVPAAFQRQPGRPATGITPQIGDWAGLYAHEMGRQQPDRQGTYASAPVAQLQRQVAAGLARSARTSSLPPLQRYAELGQTLAHIQRQPLGAATVRGSLGALLPGERPAIQRALDEANQLLQRQEAEDAQVAQLHRLQRQLAQHQQQSDQAHVMQRIQARQGSGDPLPASVRHHMEQGLNTSLNGVRIHTDREAHQLSKKAGATAFTSGKDIYFQRGRFDPNSKSGLELLGHELTHVKQQAEGGVPAGIDGDAGKEQEAQQMGAQLAAGTPQRQAKTTSSSTARAPAVQRKREAGDGGSRASKPAPERPQREAPAPRAERPEPKAPAPKAEVDTSAADAKAEQERQDQADAAREARIEEPDAQTEQARRDAIQEGTDVGTAQAELNPATPAAASDADQPGATAEPDALGPGTPHEDGTTGAEQAEADEAEFGPSLAPALDDLTGVGAPGPWAGGPGERDAGPGVDALNQTHGLARTVPTQPDSEQPEAAFVPLAIQRKTTDEPKRRSTAPKPNTTPTGPKPGATKPRATPGGPKPRATAPRAPAVPNTGARGRPGTTHSSAATGTRPGQNKPAAKPTADPMRARIGTFKDKETRKALYGLYAVIATAKGVNAKAAQQALKVFQQQVLTNKSLTPAQVQQLTRKLLYDQFGPMSGASANTIGNRPSINDALSLNKAALAKYQALTGSRDMPGVVSRFSNTVPKLSAQDQLKLAALGVGGAGVGSAALKVGGRLMQAGPDLRKLWEKTTGGAGARPTGGPAAPGGLRTRAGRTAGAINPNGASSVDAQSGVGSRGPSLVDPSRLVVPKGDGTFIPNRKALPELNKISGVPEAKVQEHAAREMYAAQLAASKGNVRRVYMGAEADRLINPKPGKQMSCDVVGVTNQGQYILTEAKGKNIQHGLDQLRYSGNQLGKEQVIQQNLVVGENLERGFKIVNGKLFREIHDGGRIDIVPVIINGKDVNIIQTRDAGR